MPKTQAKAERLARNLERARLDLKEAEESALAANRYAESCRMRLLVAIALNPATRTHDSTFAAARGVNTAALSFVRIESEPHAVSGITTDTFVLVRYSPEGRRLGRLGETVYTDRSEASVQAELFNGPEANEVLNHG